MIEGPSIIVTPLKVDGEVVWRAPSEDQGKRVWENLLQRPAGGQFEKSILPASDPLKIFCHIINIL